MARKLLGGWLTIGKDITQYTGQADNFWSIMQSRYGVDYRTRNKLKAYKNVVYGCVSLIGEALSDYEPYVEKQMPDGKWKRIDHEFIDLLRRPGGRDLKAQSFSQADLFEATGIYQVLLGDTFWYMALGKTTGKPREIIILRADKVGTDIDKKTGDINGYFIRQAAGDPIPLETEEVLRFPAFNPENPYKGKSVVEAGADYIETDEGTAEYTKNFFKNGAGLSGVLNVKGEVTKGAFRKFVRAWREKYEGTGNAGKVAVLRDSDASFTKIGLGLDELDMGGLRKMSLEDVFMTFKVPPALLGRITEGNGFGRANIEVLEYIFAKWNIEKKMQRFDSVLQFALERYYGADPRQIRVSHENIIPKDKEYELNVRNQLVDRVYTRDEIRAKDGLDPIPGGDQLFVSIQQIPIGESSLNNSASGKSQSNSDIVVKIKRAKKQKSDPSRERTERFRLTLMRNQGQYEKQFKKKLKPVLADQRAEALKNLEAHSSSLTKAAQQKLFDDGEYDQLMTSKLKPVLTDLAKIQGGLALTFAGDDQNEFHLTSNVIAYIERSTLRMATNFNDETLERLNKTLAEGIQAGEGIGELKQRVGDVYDNVEGYRLERIARTETLKASNDATVEAYKQTGYVTGKQWVVNPDACEECQVFDGTTMGLDESFLPQGSSYDVGSGEDARTVTNDYEDIDQPPLHPNCRCTIVPITEADKILALDADQLKKKLAKEKAEKAKLESEHADDKVYIKALEKHLGVHDEAISD